MAIKSFCAFPSFASSTLYHHPGKWHFLWHIKIMRKPHFFHRCSLVSRTSEKKTPIKKFPEKKIPPPALWTSTYRIDRFTRPLTPDILNYPVRWFYSNLSASYRELRFPLFPDLASRFPACVLFRRRVPRILILQDFSYEKDKKCMRPCLTICPACDCPDYYH